METAFNEVAPSHLLHRLNRIRKLSHAAAHPFQHVSADKFAPPELPNQIVEDAEESQESRLAASLQPSLHWGAAVRAAPLIPPPIGPRSAESSAALYSRKKSESISQHASERPALKVSSLYTTLPAVGSLNSQQVLAKHVDQNPEAFTIKKSTSSISHEIATAQASLNSMNRSDVSSKAVRAPQSTQAAVDFDVTGVMAAWVAHRKVFDTGSVSWDLQMPLYSQEIIENFTTEKFKQKRPGVVADLRARAVQRKVKGASKSAQAAMSEEEQMEHKERIIIMKRNKKAMDLRLGRSIVEDDADKTSTILSAAPGKTATKTNIELEFEAIQSRAIQVARENRRELVLASSSRLRPLGHVYEETNDSEFSMSDLELRLEALRSYNLNISSHDAYYEQIQEALKRTFYFASGNTQEKDFFVYALQNCGIKEPYILDVNGCSLSEMAGSGLGLMMSTPMNQLTALYARDVLIPMSSWRYMCDGIRLSRTLALLDISFSRGALQSSEGMKYFCSSLKKNVSLIELIAQGLQLGIQEYAISLADAIGTHVRLRKIDISECSMSDYSMNVRFAAFVLQVVLCLLRAQKCAYAQIRQSVMH